MESAIEWLVAALLLLGSLFALIGSFGLYKLPDFYMRLHGPTKATTLGVGSLVLASVLYFSAEGEVGLHELLITLFLFMTAPTSASMLAKAAMQVHVQRVERTKGQPWEQ
ncbi:multisubunit potassium/proton antiporter, PhaG subunit [Halopseudomonas litoralis]|uniref:Multisubunit potassium/proton antiporter, PhaG subunit n=1 Tax=Halopseudomonas litoralis TaxID=797277 RepID=A0A1H1MYQ3_9GAMM|nr:Na+/H+ antiporter subunit G [Halopseudomonas litoralis]SDR91876.1 multisubunit potassium/proton antiporter, PhaG subunit [Halopseudomonas litoralis]